MPARRNVMSRSSLSGLSDRELLARVKTLVEKERATTVEILLHLNEVERRRLYLSLGYPSLFEYCTWHLGYSNSAAGRRIRAARCIREYPEVLDLLEKNEVSLMTVSLVASVLTPENRRDLLGKIRKKSEREVEGILAGYRPPVVYRDRARPVCVAVAASREMAPANSGQTCPSTPTGGSEISPSAAGGSAAGPPRSCTELRPSVTSTHDTPTSPPNSPSVRLERKLLIQFLASEAFMQKFEKARGLLSNRMSEASFERVFETLIDEFLERHSPESKKKRREKRPAKSEETKKTVKTTCPDPNIRDVPACSDGNKRHIPAVVRDTVFARDKGQCTYVGATGRRCGSTRSLQVDHIVPYARGGSSTPGNLRLLCGKHNRFEAERIYGANTMHRYRPRE
jgi:hypothetical protein